MKRFKVSEYITPKEAEIIIQSCPKLRDKLILRTMWETGGRIAEVLSLIPDNIDLINNCIYLCNLKQKTETGIAPLKRVFLFPESTLCQDLLQYIRNNDIGKNDWVFQSNRSKSGKVSTTYIWYLLSASRGTTYSSVKWKRREGLATTLGVRKIKGGIRRSAWPHLFRHGNAHFVLDRVGRLDIVKEQLGHSSIMTTEGYTQLSDEERKRIIDSG